MRYPLAPYGYVHGTDGLAHVAVLVIDENADEATTWLGAFCEVKTQGYAANPFARTAPLPSVPVQRWLEHEADFKGVPTCFRCAVP